MEGARDQGPVGPSFSIFGTVTSTGTSNFSQGGTGTGAQFQGSFYADGTGSGTWSDTGLPGSGNWSCNRTP